MRHLPYVVAVTLGLAAGCASSGDAPSWQRPGLGGGKFGASLTKAMDETDNEMKMESDRPTSQRKSEP
jgi:hypothetical protein